MVEHRLLVRITVQILDDIASQIERYIEGLQPIGNMLGE